MWFFLVYGYIALYLVVENLLISDTLHFFVVKAFKRSSDSNYQCLNEKQRGSLALNKLKHVLLKNPIV